jgi:hypothetical protein
MEVEIMKAIPRASRFKRVAFLVVTALVLSWIDKNFVGPALRAYLSVKDPVEAFRRFQWVMIGIGASLVPFAAYFALFAARIIRSRQFPYPGAKVWRDTRIVRDSRALVRGWTMAFCATLLFGLAGYAAYIPTMVAKKRRAQDIHTVLDLPLPPMCRDRPVKCSGLPELRTGSGRSVVPVA